MLEVGEYVRTVDGKIIKVDWVGQAIATDKQNTTITKQDILKHSKNIIDLIEVGDYVNGQEVKRIGDYEDFKRIDFEEYEDYIYEDDIKSIVTKEQFANIEYKVNT